MKQLTLIWMFLLFVSCHSKTPLMDKTPHQRKDEVAKFEFQGEFHNFGKLTAGEVVSFAFSFKNIGNAPLVITKADVDCSCIQVSFPHEAIAVGKQAFIEVTYNSAGEVGKQLETVTIQANTGKPTQLQFVAEVKNEMIDLNN